MMAKVRKTNALLLWLALGVSWPAAAQGNDAWGYLFLLKTRGLYPLQGPSLLIGRSNRADILLTDPRVSRRHAEIRLENGVAELVDLASTNGTRINGQGLSPDQPAPLQPGDVIYLADEPLLFHRNRAELWKDALQHVLLGQIVRLKIPVAQDRESTAFGTTRLVASATRATVDLEAAKIEVDFGQANEGRGSEGGWVPGEAAFVGTVALTEGALSLSLWGWERGGTAVSRRASYAKLKHGELQLTLPGASPAASRARFEELCSVQGMSFLTALLEPVLETVTLEEADVVSLQFARELADRQEAVATRDAANALAFRHRLAGADPEFPALAARARARWVKSAAAERRAVLSAAEREALRAALLEAKQWARRAADLGAKDKALAGLQGELEAAEKLLEPRP
jgi:hypothetical protein